MEANVNQATAPRRASRPGSSVLDCRSQPRTSPESPPRPSHSRRVRFAVEGVVLSPMMLGSGLDHTQRIGGVFPAWPTLHRGNGRSRGCYLALVQYDEIRPGVPSPVALDRELVLSAARRLTKSPQPPKLWTLGIFCFSVLLTTFHSTFAAVALSPLAPVICIPIQYRTSATPELSKLQAPSSQPAAAQRFRLELSNSEARKTPRCPASVVTSCRGSLWHTIE